MASYVELSPSHFSFLYKKSTGYSPMDYYFRLKIRRACEYLDLTQMQIKEISEKLGYEDPFYFSKVFRKIMGESPREYRKRQKG